MCVRPVDNRGDVNVLPVIHRVVYVGGVARLRFGVRVKAGRQRAAAVRREVPDDGPAVRGQERRLTLVPAADEAEAFQIVQVAAYGSRGLAGVVGEAFLGRECAATVGVGVVGQADEDGEALWWDVGGMTQRPGDSFNAHGGAESPMLVGVSQGGARHPERACGSRAAVSSAA
ncbi:hypothetical protein Nm8I071_22300 [Nonomuraea sp. TT08I-71]|nr:hypothetical protein Nm8I071_22300 [Nonomuraea sp. TT08I-71]